MRLHFSVESVIRSASSTAAVPEKAVAANPDLKGKNPLEVMDAVVKALADAVSRPPQLRHNWGGRTLSPTA